MSKLNQLFTGSMIVFCGGLNAEQAIAQFAGEPLEAGTAFISGEDSHASRFALDSPGARIERVHSFTTVDLGANISQQSQPEEEKKATTVPATAPIPEPGSKWRFMINSHWWLPQKISGDVLVGTTNTDVDIDLQTIFEDLNFVVEGGFEVTNDKWSFVLWSLYMNLGTDVNTTVPIGTFDTSIKFKATVFDMMGAYRIYHGPLGKSPNATWDVDLMAGIMTWDVDIKISETGSGGFDPNITEQDRWADPMVGGRVLFSFNDKLNASLRGEIGGFDIGSASQLGWNVTAMVKYKVSSRVDLAAGYRYLSIDWGERSGLEKVGYDLKIYGPIIGVTINF